MLHEGWLQVGAPAPAHTSRSDQLRAAGDVAVRNGAPPSARRLALGSANHPRMILRRRAGHLSDGHCLSLLVLWPRQGARSTSRGRRIAPVAYRPRRSLPAGQPPEKAECVSLPTEREGQESTRGQTAAKSPRRCCSKTCTAASFGVFVVVALAHAQLHNRLHAGLGLARLNKPTWTSHVNVPTYASARLCRHRTDCDRFRCDEGGSCAQRRQE